MRSAEPSGSGGVPMNFIAADSASDAGDGAVERSRQGAYSRLSDRLPQGPLVKSALPLKLVIPLVLGIRRVAGARGLR